MEISSPTRIIVLDAGPIIGSMNVLDAHHEVSVRGFRQLRAARTRMIVPTSILFEVYKHLAYRVSLEAAQRSVVFMRGSLHVAYLSAEDLDHLFTSLEGIPWWRGSLEDATIAMLASQLNVPLWTFNFRDLTAFRDVELWSPA